MNITNSSTNNTSQRNVQKTCFKLRTKPPQFTKGKTEETINDITQRYLLTCSNVIESEHIIDIVITNNSLPETEQWKVRTEKQFVNFEAWCEKFY